MIRVRTNEGLKAVSAVRVRDTSNVLRNVSQVYLRDATGLKPLLGVTLVTASPDSVFGSGYSPGEVIVTTNASSVTPLGAGSYSYSWQTADPGWVAVNPTAQTTAFRSPPLAPGASSFATFACDVTGPGGTVTSNAVYASASNNYAPL